MSPVWRRPATFWFMAVTLGMGFPFLSVAFALNSWAKATVHCVAAVPGSRWAEVSPPAPWYQTTSRFPPEPAAIHGKTSARPASGVAPRLSGLTWYAFDHVAPWFFEKAYWTL